MEKTIIVSVENFKSETEEERRANLNKKLKALLKRKLLV